jgi:hypothetical protein
VYAVNVKSYTANNATKQQQKQQKEVLSEPNYQL